MFELPKKIKMIAAALTIVGLGLLVIGFNTDYSQASDGHDDHAVAQKDHDALSTHGDYPGEAHAAMIQAALTGELDDAETIQDKVFGLHRIASCPNVPDHILNPRDSWANVAAYDIQADMLAGKFNANFKAYEAGCSDDILSGSPLKA